MIQAWLTERNKGGKEGNEGKEEGGDGAKEKKMVEKSEKQKEKMHCPPEPERRGLCTRPQCMLHGLGVCASGGHGYTKKISRELRKNSRVW